MAKSTARKEGIARNKQMRNTITDFNTAQLTNFFKGLDCNALDRVKKSLAKIDDVKKKEEILAKQAQVLKLQKEIAELEG